MTAPLALSTAPPQQIAQDYARLRAEGIALLQALVGDVWTDYNTHDPGVTILEQVCYAITDLAYRADYTMADLLARGADSDASLPTPGRILPTHPVTAADLRKLLIDVLGIKNAWIEPYAPTPLYVVDNTLGFGQRDITSEAITLRGLYTVALELDDVGYLDNDPAQQARSLQTAIDRLHANRALGEDFATITVLEAEFIAVTASVEIADAEDAQRVLLEIYQRLADHISPPIPARSLTDWLADGYPVDVIFDSPFLDHGFIDSADLHERRAVLRTSDLIHEIMQVPGVRVVKHITVSNGAKTEPWSLDLDAGRAAKFDVKNARIQLEHRGRPLPDNLEQVRTAFIRRLREQARPAAQADVVPPSGRDRQVGAYTSIQDQFPAVYGLGQAGLPASAPPERIAQVRQLQAYLLFFDQILANSFAQLAGVRDLFAFSAPDAHTYFAQLVPGSEAVLRADRARVQAITEATPAHPEALTEAQAQHDRRNRLLNHLLARFSEDLSAFGLDDPAQTVAAKEDFLSHYADYSRARGLGTNVLLDEEHPSGLELRLRHKLHIADETPIFVVEHILLRPLPDDEEPTLPLLEQPMFKDPYSLRVSLVFPDTLAPRDLFEQVAREETPAHLVLSFHWLDSAALSAFSQAHAAWSAQYRRFRQRG